MLSFLMPPGVFTERARPRRSVLAAAVGLAVLIAAPVAFAQPDELGESGETAEGSAAEGSAAEGSAAEGSAAEGSAATSHDTLVCDGGWRYPLTETRREFGPARFARQTSLHRDIALVAAGFAYCETIARAQFSGHEPSKGPCYGMLRLAEKVDYVASNVFETADESACECLTQQAEVGSSCESRRNQLTSLRHMDDILVDRAELVLAFEVCAHPERNTNRTLRDACNQLDAAVAAEYDGGRGLPGNFSLAAPIPVGVAARVDRIRSTTDGRYLANQIPENIIGVRETLCGIHNPNASQNSCELAELPGAGQPEREGEKPVLPVEVWGAKRQEVLWSMCNELALAGVNANTCRSADVYIDERGELHLNRSLTTRAQRRSATLCIDISDFDESSPLMVTLGLDPTSSVPERIWPGETMRIGPLIDRPVTPEDILRIHVLGKARGISLSEVLRVNGVPGFTGETLGMRNTRASREESCRLARSWVPVVDHEVPVGATGRQSVIPIEFGRGRDGETPGVDAGDYVVLWVRNIEPSGTVLVEYADGQTVGYHPPPLLGEPPDVEAADADGPDGLMNPGAAIRGSGAGVGQPLLPRRARYPGSRVLRLGTPAGNQLYNIKVCTRTTTAEEVVVGDRTCEATGSSVILHEKLFVQGDYHFGVRMHFGYTYFPVPRLVGRRTPAAQAAGDNVFEVVESSGGTADYDVALLLAVYPFGRNPRRFSYKPWTRDYWKHSALVAGFTVRSITPWDNFYAGASLPIANGVSLSALTHVSRRYVPVDARRGDLFTGSGDGDISLSSFYDSRSALVVGVSFGMTVDYDLFERAFTHLWGRLRGGQGQFVSGAPPPRYDGE